MCSFLDLLDFNKMQQDKKVCIWKGETYKVIGLFATFVGKSRKMRRTDQNKQININLN